MKVKKLLILSLFLMIFLVPNVFSATIHGTIYDFNLDIAKDAIVEVDSIPEQKYVSKDGIYILNLAIGEYVIKINYEDNYKKYIFEQNIVIKDDRDYVLDLILFPDISEETELLDEAVDVLDVYEEEISIYWWQIIVAVLFILAIVFVIIFVKRKKKKKKTNIEGDLIDDVLNFIKEEGSRVTQKDIRKQFPVSEAKVSLVITELEDKGLLKKVKRGRGNIVILNKK